MVWNFKSPTRLCSGGTVNVPFDDGESIDQVLKIIALALGGVRIERHGDSATISLIRGQNTAR